MELLKLVQKDWVPAVVQHIKGGLHRTGYCIIESPIAIVYRKTQVDEVMCQQLGYEICELFSNSGTILSNAGDIAIGHLGNIDDGWCERFIVYFIDWLKAQGLDATNEKNDILVDGYKVCGMCVNRYGRIDYSCGFIGINTNLSHIKTICRKPMVKVPKGLGEFGITTQDIEQMLMEFHEQFGHEYV